MVVPFKLELMALTFSLFLDLTNKKFDQFKSKNSFVEFCSLIDGFYASAAEIFPEEVDLILSNLNVYGFIEKIKKENKEELKKILGFDVKTDGTVLLRDKDGTRIVKFKDLGSLVEVLVPEDRKDLRYLVLSFFSVPSNFMELQFYFASKTEFPK